MSTSASGVDLHALRAGPRTVEALRAAGLIDERGRQFGLDLMLPPREWGRWVARGLLFVGTALCLSAIVYFFAFNWANLSRLEKLGGIEAGLVAVLAAALILPPRGLGSRVLLLSASVLLGVFLAVFGQIYQTGADAWQLFAVWSVLMLPWAVLARFGALWIVWLVVAELALALYWDQVVPFSRDQESLILPILVLVNAVALVVREWRARRGVHEWHAWTRSALSAAVIVFSALPIGIGIVSPGDMNVSLAAGCLVGVATHAALAFWYSRANPDLGVLGTTVLSVCILMETLAFKIFERAIDRFEALGLLLMTGITLAIFTAGIVVLRRLHLAIGQRHD